MNSKERLIAALDLKKIDRLPVTTHHITGWFLKNKMNNISLDEFFDIMKMDKICWCLPIKAREQFGEQFDTKNGAIVTDDWRISSEELSHSEYITKRYTISTPSGNLSLVMQSNEFTTWLIEHPVKKKADIEIIAKWCPAKYLDVEKTIQLAEEKPDHLIRGNIPCFDLFGQPGCWQDACCLFGVQALIMETYDDPEWVHEFLNILRDRKLKFADSCLNSGMDILEMGGGDASSSVISPEIFDEFVAPYDQPIIKKAQENGMRVAYHTCGSMMPFLERIADMGVNAMETFTPAGMGGDTNLAEAKRRIGDKVCMIGGFDQFHYFKNCTETETREAVRRCFKEAGANGGFILSPSDHFFDAEPELIAVYADEAIKCTY